MKNVLSVLTLVVASIASAQPTYSTGFEPPEFTAGNVDGQNGWGYVDNSPTGGTIEPPPLGSPAMFGTQSLAIVMRNDSPDFAFVSNRLHSASIDPPAGETGSTAGGVAAVNPRSHFQATLWFHTPAQPILSSRADGRFAELDPSSQGPVSTDPANRYAQVRLSNSTNTAGGDVHVQIGWYAASGFTLATVAHLQWNQWYRFEYLIQLVDGTNGSEPNDRFALTIFDSNGTQLGTACGSTWELPWRAGSFGGGATPRAIDGFDFWSLGVVNGTAVGHLDQFSMQSLNLANPLAVTVDGDANVCFGATTTLTATATGDLPVTSYVWRDATNTIVGNTATLNASAGTYTVTVTDTLCVSATSAPFIVNESADLTATITGASSVPLGATTTLTANVTGGSGTIDSYTWRNALSNIVGTSATLDAGPGTYTVTVNDATCGTATSAPFTVAAAVTEDVPALSHVMLAMLAFTLALLALRP